MKVILLSDVKGVGKKDEIVDVAPGYGRNYLIRRNLAVMATDTSLEQLKSEELAAEERQDELREKALKDKEMLENMKLKFELNAGEGGRVFGSVSSKEIESRLKKDHNIKVDRRKFVDKGPFNLVGVNNVKIELFKGVVATLKVVINAKS